MSKPSIVVDCDGILYNWNRGVRLCLRRHRNVSLLEDESPDWEYVDRSLTPAQKKWLWTEGIAKGMYTLGGAYEGAREAMDKLKEMTRELWIVTSRPIEAETITIKWLRDKMGIYHEQVYFCGGNGDKADIKADIYLDDAPLALVSLVNLRPEALILGWKRRWNEELQIAFEGRHGIEWVADWEHVLMYVASMGGNSG